MKPSTKEKETIGSLNQSLNRKNTKHSSKMQEMTIAEYMDMMKSMFKLMVDGVTINRIQRLNELKEASSDQRLLFFKRLYEDMSEEYEERLYLWLTMS